MAKNEGNSNSGSWQKIGQNEQLGVPSTKWLSLTWPTVKRGMDCGMESFRGIINWLPVEPIIMGVASYMACCKRVCTRHVSQQKSTDVKYTSLTRQQWDA